MGAGYLIRDIELMPENSKTIHIYDRDFRFNLPTFSDYLNFFVRRTDGGSFRQRDIGNIIFQGTAPSTRDFYRLESGILHSDAIRMANPPIIDFSIDPDGRDLRGADAICYNLAQISTLKNFRDSDGAEPRGSVEYFVDGVLYVTMPVVITTISDQVKLNVPEPGFIPIVESIIEICDRELSAET